MGSWVLFSFCGYEWRRESRKSSIRLLTVMRFPCAFCHLHIRKYSFKARLFRAAGIHTESDFSSAFPQMTDTHLAEALSVIRAFDAVIILSAAETIPHRFDACRDGGRCPVGVSVIGHHGAQVLEGFIFIFHRAFQPVLRIKIQNNTALIKTVMAVRKI